MLSAPTRVASRRTEERTLGAIYQGAAAHSGRTHWNYLLKTLKPYRICPTYAVRVHHTVGTGSGMILICHKHTYALNATLSQYTYTEQTQVRGVTTLYTRMLLREHMLPGAYPGAGSAQRAHT